MEHKLHLYNTIKRETERFIPINAPHVGMYLCGPTVYGHPHLGHIRGPLTFDVLYRYLSHLGYSVRYVRNITDVGHLVDDADEGEDKIQKRARLEKIEPMEVAQFYADSYTECLRLLNIKRPGIEPRASGHIPEQIEMIQEILEAGLAYEVNGSVYFDVPQYANKFEYGKLSGRKLEELMAGAGNASRELEGQEEKRNAADFALWKRAEPDHIMKWNSPWGLGFPGWHIECSAMSKKYLGEVFDIHGGGMDLLFPHHECEIAQSSACSGKVPANYWLHNNMITINGQKMAKSLNNGIQLEEFFKGNHPLLEQAYGPMTLRFFILMAHYRGTLDFSNDALKAAEKGLQRLENAFKLVDTLTPSDTSEVQIEAIKNASYEALNDDLNTPQLIAQLFELARLINLINDQKLSASASDIKTIKEIEQTFFRDILGMQNSAEGDESLLDGLMHILIDIRNQAKNEKNYALSDEIRNKITSLGIVIKDAKDHTTWSK